MWQGRFLLTRWNPPDTRGAVVVDLPLAGRVFGIFQSGKLFKSGFVWLDFWCPLNSFRVWTIRYTC
jgi:hypothetical protein